MEIVTEIKEICEGKEMELPHVSWRNRRELLALKH
jgi:hypothetical protein